MVFVRNVRTLCPSRTDLQSVPYGQNLPKVYSLFQHSLFFYLYITSKISHIFVSLTNVENTFVRKRKEKQAFLLLFLSLNRIFAAHYGDTCAFHANGVSSVERESGASPEQCPLL